jgi:hypothetical protein
MKDVTGKLAIVVALTTSLAAAGCFGPFKKKSGGGGGGGGAPASTTTDNEKEEEGETTSSGKTTASNTTTSVPEVPGAKDGYGCLQGFVTDGFTGQPIDYDASKIFVLIRGTKLQANKVEGITGQYFICEIPGEETYPIYAFLDGYMPFESSVEITTTRAKRVAADGQAVVDEVKIADPLELKDVRLFPLGNTTRDLRVRVVHNGAPVKDALVDIEAKASGASGTFAFEGTFANSIGTRILPQRQTTGDDGYATFAASSLSLGAAYSVTVHPPIGTSYTVPAASSIILGVSGAAESDFNTYDMNVVLGEGNEGIKVLTCSTQFQNYNSSGVLKVMFNRSVTVIDKDTLDNGVVLTRAGGAIGGTAIVGNNGDLTLATPTANNNASEKVTASVSGNVLTLTPKFNNNDTIKALDPNVGPTDAAVNSKNKDAEVSYTFSSVILKVVGDEDNNSVPLSTLFGGAGQLPLGDCPAVVRFFPEFD